MTSIAACLAFIVVLLASVDSFMSTNIPKQVVSTSWWPPGTENKSESVGILVYTNLLFCTGMMEREADIDKTADAELSDVTDILEAADMNAHGLVSCLVNAPANRSDVVRRAYADRLGEDVALSVVEITGEYDGYFNESLSCVGVDKNSAQQKVHATTHGISDTEVDIVRYPTPSNPSEWSVKISGRSSDPHRLLTWTEELLMNISEDENDPRSDMQKPLDNLYDCLVFTDITDGAHQFRAALGARSTTTVALTVVPVPATFGLPQDIHYAIACSGGSGRKHVVRSSIVNITVAQRLVHVDGIYGTRSNATDALSALGDALRLSGSRLDLVSNCLYFMRHPNNIEDVFSGFSDVFNKNHPPPPTRSEFASSAIPDPFEVIVKCVAAVEA